MRILLIFLVFPWILQAHTMQELFNALKTHAVTRVDEMTVKQAKASENAVDAKLYPTINLVGKYDNYSMPTSMLPIPPNELIGLVQNHETQPFSYNIYRGGVSFSMPIFVKSLYTLADKAKILQESAKAKKRINLLKNEAILVDDNANLVYFESLKKALLAKKSSLLQTRKIISLKVKNGRSAEANLYSIDDDLNQIEIQLNAITIQQEKVKSQIEALTGIRVQHSIAMKQIGTYQAGILHSLKPLQEQVQAQRLNLRAQKETLYPTITAHGNYMYQHGTAYNTRQAVYNQYGDVGVVISIPIVSMGQYAGIKQAKVKLLTSQYHLDVMRDDLMSKANMLQNSLSLLKNSIHLNKQSIQNQEKLLKIATVSYLSGRMPVVDYLKYEDNVVIAKAALYENKAKKIEAVMQLAVIYANNIEEIVR